MLPVEDRNFSITESKDDHQPGGDDSVRFNGEPERRISSWDFGEVGDKKETGSGSGRGVRVNGDPEQGTAGYEGVACCAEEEKAWIEIKFSSTGSGGGTKDNQSM